MTALATWSLTALVMGFGGCKGSSAPPVQDATPVAAADSVVVEEVAVYACPMHAEVKQAQPGQCSVCGMDLVLVDSVEDEGDGMVPDSLDHDQVD